MSRQSAYPMPNETDLESVIATSTGTTHILTVVVKAGNKFTISDSTLRIRNGDKVIWRWSGVGDKETPSVKFDGKVVKDDVPGARGGGDVSHDILKELKEAPLPEPYGMFLKAEDGKETKLTYESSGFARRDEDPPLPPEPYLVIDQIGDPITMDDPRGHRWGPRRTKRSSK